MLKKERERERERERAIGLKVVMIDNSFFSLSLSLSLSPSLLLLLLLLLLFIYISLSSVQPTYSQLLELTWLLLLLPSQSAHATCVLALASPAGVGGRAQVVRRSIWSGAGQPAWRLSSSRSTWLSSRDLPWCASLHKIGKAASECRQTGRHSFIQAARTRTHLHSSQTFIDMQFHFSSCSIDLLAD